MKDIFGVLTFKNVEIIKKVMRARTKLQLLMTIQSERLFSSAKFNNTPWNNWKPSFEVDFSKNSTKTIRLLALDFYEVIVDEAEGFINYHLIEIESS